MILKSFCLVLLVSMAFFLSRSDPLESQEVLEWEVSAQCLPHTQVQSPQSMRVQLFYHSARESLPSMEAFLSIDGGGYLTSLRNEFGFPENRWVSALFEAPMIQSRLYCQEAKGPRALQISYYPQQGLKIFLSRSGDLSREELDSIHGPVKTSLTVTPQGAYQHEYAAGKDTPNPYWLVFSVPLSGFPSSKATTLRYYFP